MQSQQQMVALSRLRASDRIKALEARVRELEAVLRQIDGGTFIDDPPGYAASQMRAIARAGLKGRE